MVLVITAGRVLVVDEDHGDRAEDKKRKRSERAGDFGDEHHPGVDVSRLRFTYRQGPKYTSVVVAGDVIDQVMFDVGRSQPFEGPQHLDCRDLTLMPGLIDSHVHVTASSANLRMPSTMPPSLLYARAVPILSGMLDRGFTTVRDCGGADHGLADAGAAEAQALRLRERHERHQLHVRERHERVGHGSSWSAAEGAGVLFFRNSGVFDAGVFGSKRPKHP